MSERCNWNLIHTLLPAGGRGRAAGAARRPQGNGADPNPGARAGSPAHISACPPTALARASKPVPFVSPQILSTGNVLFQEKGGNAFNQHGKKVIGGWRVCSSSALVQVWYLGLGLTSARWSVVESAAVLLMLGLGGRLERLSRLSHAEKHSPWSVE